MMIIQYFITECFNTSYISLLIWNPLYYYLEPLDAPVISGVLLQDSALILVFSNAPLCSNSSWEVCVASDARHQTEHCSRHLAEDRLTTVDAGKGSMYSIRSRVLFGDRQSPYSDSTTLGATSVLPRGTVPVHITIFALLSLSLLL